MGHHRILVPCPVGRPLTYCAQLMVTGQVSFTCKEHDGDTLDMGGHEIPCADKRCTIRRGWWEGGGTNRLGGGGRVGAPTG